MLYIEVKSNDIKFSLAAEEYVMRNFPVGEPVFMLWRTQKCVIIGRSQIAAAEIDLQMAHSLGIDVIRRSSGGGAVFSDSGNIMQSIITPFNESDEPKTIEREQLVEPMAKALRKMGIPAVAEGRNDITVDGRKISGLAQYAIKNRLCSHGSLLYDVDMDLLTGVLKTDPEKINSKALKSMRARVANLCEYFNPKLSVDEFFELLKSYLFDKETGIGAVTGTEIKNYNFTDDEIKRINVIRDEKYANPEWINGATPKFSFHNVKRFPAGKIEIFMYVEHGVINSCKIYGDFLGIHSVEELEKNLINQSHEYNIISGILSDIDLRLYLGNITKEELLSCLF